MIKIKLRSSILFTRKKSKEQVIKMFDDVEQELMICCDRIDKNINDLMIYADKIENIKSKIKELKNIKLTRQTIKNTLKNYKKYYG